MTLSRYPAWIALLALMFPLGSVSCSSAPAPEPATPYVDLTTPTRVEPLDDLERSVLGKLGELQAGEPADVSGAAVQVGEIYDAASGRRCRSVSITESGDARQRLACEFAGDGDAPGWAFVPDVVSADRSSQ